MESDNAILLFIDLPKESNNVIVLTLPSNTFV